MVKPTREEMVRARHLQQVVILRKAGLSMQDCADVLDATVEELAGVLLSASRRGEYDNQARRRFKWVDVNRLPYGVKRWLVKECENTGFSLEEMVFAIIQNAHNEATQVDRQNNGTVRTAARVLLEQPREKGSIIADAEYQAACLFPDAQTGKEMVTEVLSTFLHNIIGQRK